MAVAEWVAMILAVFMALAAILGALGLLFAILFASTGNDYDEDR